jgi:WD40 repeat protein
MFVIPLMMIWKDHPGCLYKLGITCIIMIELNFGKLSGHIISLFTVCFHPELPIVLTGSEDGTVRIWHAGTYRLESSLNYGLERVWTVACMRGSNNVALGLVYC